MSDTARPRLLDLFCGAGGAAMGYHQAGFKVIGVDIEPQPHYPFEFHQADALDCAPVAFAGEMYDAIHASPPCQAYSDLQKQNKREYPYLIWQTRMMLRETGLPYVIENVEGAPLIDPVTLCGVAFPYLRVIRHRLFEASFDIPQPRHWPHPLVFTHDKRKAHYGKLDQDEGYVQVTGGGNCTVANKRAAMGIDWMTGSELNEAIPPAYTEYVGTHLMAEVQARRETADAVYSGPLRGCQREDLIRKIEERREDREFMARLRRIVAENRDVLDRLAEGGD